MLTGGQREGKEIFESQFIPRYFDLDEFMFTKGYEESLDTPNMGIGCTNTKSRVGFRIEMQIF